MSAAVRIAGKVHKWLALLMAIQILFWFASGLFFAVAPIERVRSEHMIAEQRPVPIPIGAAADGLQRVAAANAAPGERIELRTMLGRPVALVTAGEARPRLYDLASGRQLSPVPARLAVAIAEADHAGDARAAGVEPVTENSTEYRGALPAWRVRFDDGANRALYVAADTGTVTARRSTLWRAFDFLWSLHIMDFKNREDFNTPLLIISTALALVVILTGIVMFPSRLGYSAWKRRRAAARERAQ
ncbi:PepSY domain-containing protein [Sphingosinicella sp. LHD-64]|uniref:PepSY domain-containing protein n=1 Tax=Sphingosinicella sp. LHD-64 TaxID=3072139 RepID=UPI00280D6AB0|nr:PepSY domain-containing protein [Sphingosinicella sp. LHD-64]MDQ8756755.1 PepSY domain-containing protein [Sphingosinicella sp. LHD-64]